MNARRVVDLAAVLASRERLRALVEAHPELRGERSAENVDGWEAILREDEAHMGKTTQFGFRLSDALVERLDAYVEQMRATAPGMDVTRADAVRVLLTLALDAEGVKGKATKGKGR